MLLDIVRRFGHQCTARLPACELIRTDSQNELIRANPISIRTTPNANGSTQSTYRTNRLVPTLR